MYPETHCAALQNDLVEELRELLMLIFIEHWFHLSYCCCHCFILNIITFDYLLLGNVDV